MIARAYRPEKDAEGLKALLDGEGDVDFRKDGVIVVEEDGRLIGCLVARPCLFVHELRAEAEIMRRRVAEMAVAYAMGAAAALNHREAVFIVDAGNEAMHRFMEGYGATKERDGAFYSLEVK